LRSFETIFPRRRRTGLLVAIKLLAAAVAILLALAGLIVLSHFALGRLIGAPLALSLILTAMRLMGRGRRALVKEAKDVLAIDQRPPIVYLRPFSCDETGFGLRSYEEELALALRDVGPFVAIGNPGDPVPVPGAARLYTDYDDWQGPVTELIQKAQLVMVRIGSSAGLLWELAWVVKRVDPLKLVLASAGKTGTHAATYRQFRSQTTSIFSRALPMELGEAEFIYFAADWSPTPLVLRPETMSPAPQKATSDAARLQGQALWCLTHWFLRKRRPVWRRLLQRRDFLSLY
jgi:hypothetical protein